MTVIFRRLKIRKPSIRNDFKNSPEIAHLVKIKTLLHKIYLKFCTTIAHTHFRLNAQFDHFASSYQLVVQLESFHKQLNNILHQPFSHVGLHGETFVCPDKQLIEFEQSFKINCSWTKRTELLIFGKVRLGSGVLP